MRQLALACAAAALLLGCSTPYLIHLQNGDVVQSKDEPHFDRDSGFYEFEDVRGRHVRLNKDQVVRMEELH